LQQEHFIPKIKQPRDSKHDATAVHPKALAGNEKNALFAQNTSNRHKLLVFVAKASMRVRLVRESGG